MDELLEQFLLEGRDLVAQATADLSALRADPRDAAAIDGIFRAFHTLKGSVALFAMGPAERVLHAAEDVLEAARRGGAVLDAPMIAKLVSCIDQTDRWIDEMERPGQLADGAAEIARDLIALLASGVSAPLLDRAAHDVDAADWLLTLKAREAACIAGAAQELTAFRYQPDADCFFRGEDPLAAIAAVPGLVSVAILPVAGEWPAADVIAPFSCIAVLEGLSSAPMASVRAAFRMMPDQVQLATITPGIAPAEPRQLGTENTGDAAVRVKVSRIDALADGLGEMLVGINALAPLVQEARTASPLLAAALSEAHAGLERAAANLHRRVSAVRSVPLEPSLRRLPRLTREIAEALGKNINFSISGDGVEVDKQIADGLFEPLLHLLRNAIDHGIESPEARRLVGKPAAGKIALSFHRDNDKIVATLSDDGAGIDIEKIKTIAVARHVIDQAVAQTLPDAAALRLIFLPGFSTADTVSDVSGRGVGMDAVQAAIERLRGSIDVESAIGHGTTFRMRLPVNALTTQLLVIEVGEDRYGVALDQVEETVRIENDALIPVAGGLACVLRGRTMPVLDLASLLGGEPQVHSHAKLLVTQSGGEFVAWRVGGFAERIDVLLRQPGTILASVPGVSGSALLGNGDVLLVLDLPELAA